MAKFRFSSRNPSYIPFPSLVSVILFYHKIQYIGHSESVKTIPVFGKQQLNMMRINFEEGSGQSRAPSRSRASHARAQEAQSAAPPPQSSMPSDFDARVKAIVDQAIAEMTEKIEVEVGKLVAEVTKGNHDLVDVQEELKDKVENFSGHIEDHDAKISTLMVSNLGLSDKMDKILKILKPADPSHSGSGFGSPPIPKPEPEPFTSPSFTFTTPIISTSPLASSTPATEIIPPSHTSTIKLDSPPPTPLVDPIPEESISAPTVFEDDKGGENTGEE